MLRGKRTRKGIALTFLVIFLSNTLAPLSAYALTSGPTAPEATSFEPVDTTDMVNLQSGDFTYNIPLLEVPGPEGGYPLSLSYHAGIEPNLDASWVGLGWALNPGAINRNVNGYPDDWCGEQQTVRDYWHGGETFTIGIDVGVAMGPASATFGLTFGYDTYQGFGFGFSIGAGVSLGGNFSLGAEFAVGPFSNSPTVGVGLGYHLGPLNGNIGIQTNFESISYGGGVSLSGGGSGILQEGPDGRYHSGGFGLKGLGVSISSDGSSTSVMATVGGLTQSAYNSNAGKIQTSGFSFGFAFGIGFSFSYQRYWSDESTTTKSYGTLYDDYYGGYLNYNNYDNVSFDSYFLSDGSFVDNGDPYMEGGGTYPDVDLYTVTGQGIGGNIKPYHYQRYLLNQNRKDNNGNYKIKYKNINPSSYSHINTGYRFVNDFSNSYRQHLNTWDVVNNPNSPLDFNPIIGQNDGLNKYDASTNQLAGSKSIQWFNSIQIQDGTAKNNGFVDIQCDGFIRPNVNDPANSTFKYQVGGFSITNETGVTYHYALPVYSKNEKTYTEKINTSLGDGKSDRWNTLKKPARYAYTWYLTSITGPDFVDRNNNGLADGNDWGYWVNFSYGKWTDAYKWRNPAEGFIKDLDNNFQSYSEGEKEIYYLNKISTRSHTAIFEKDLRNDGKSSYPYLTAFPVPKYQNSGRIDGYSEGVMRLDKIYLFNNSDLPAISPSASTTLNKPAANGFTGSPSYYYNFSGHFATNLIDKYDIDPNRATINSKALRVIEFNYDYSLCPRTINSFDYANASVKTGKLTLNYISFKGKGGVNTLPPTRFFYELNGSQQATGSLSFQITDISKGLATITSSNSYVKGELITFIYNSKNYYGLITDTNKFKLLVTTGLSQTSYSVTASKTKNPEYNKDAYDEWGYFKGDYDWTIATNRENQKRITSPASAKSTDVWSLRQAITPLGAEINIEYESDTYGQVVLSGNASIEYYPYDIDLVNKRFTIQFNGLGYKPSELLSVGDVVNLVMYRYVSFSEISPCPPGTEGTLETTPLLTYYETIGSPYLTQAMPTGLTVYSVNDANNTVTITYEPSGMWKFGPEQYGQTCYNIEYNIGSGNLFTVNSREMYGGGLRVKSIAVKNTSSGVIAKTLYDYKKPGTQISSGVTSYEPGILDVPAVNDVDYKRKLYQYLNHLLKISREVPPPGIMYEYVTQSNTIQNPDEVISNTIDGKNVYRFEVFRKNMIDRYDLNEGYYQGRGHNKTIRNYTSGVGNLKSVISYDKNGRKLSETINTFLSDGLEDASYDEFLSQYNARLANYNYQGVIIERFAIAKDLYFTSSPQNQSVASAREEYPSIMTGQKSYNYLTNTSTSSQNLGFDYYNGQINKKLDIDANGNRFLTEIIPAYRKYPELGFKQNKSTQFGIAYPNKNMLTQAAQTYVYKVDGSNNKIGLVSANVETWSTAVPALVSSNDNSTVIQNGSSGNGFVWRKQSSYSWLQNGKKTGNITPVNEFVDFNWANPASLDASWKKTGEFTLYDVYSKQLEAMDVNGNYSTVKMGYDNTRVILKAAPAKYHEIAYSGAEDNIVNGKFSSNVTAGSGIISTTYAHTGTSSLKLSVGQTGFIYNVPVSQLQAGKNYFASAWVYSSNGQVPGGKIFYQRNSETPVYSSAATITKKAGSWYLLEFVVPASIVTAGSTLNVGLINNGSSDEYYDDFRFCPLNAGVTSYVYDKFTGEVTYILDNNNLFTKYEYDAAGRLKATYRETFSSGTVKLNEIEYNIAAPYRNATISQNFTRQCDPGQTGSVVTYTVSEGTYSSSISQTDADNQAWADINANGQNYANANGTCTTSTIPVTFYNYGYNAYGTITAVSTSGSYYTYLSFPSYGNSATMYLPADTYHFYFSSSYGEYRYYEVNYYSVSGSSGYETISNVPINYSCYGYIY